MIVIKQSNDKTIKDPQKKKNEVLKSFEQGMKKGAR